MCPKCEVRLRMYEEWNNEVVRTAKKRMKALGVLAGAGCVGFKQTLAFTSPCSRLPSIWQTTSSSHHKIFLHFSFFPFSISSLFRFSFLPFFIHALWCWNDPPQNACEKEVSDRHRACLLACFAWLFARSFALLLAHSLVRLLSIYSALVETSKQRKPYEMITNCCRAIHESKGNA